MSSLGWYSGAYGGADARVQTQLYARGDACATTRRRRESRVSVHCDEKVAASRVSRVDEPTPCRYAFEVVGREFC